MSLLQSPQVSGLAYLLNTLMSRGANTGQGSTSSAPADQPSRSLTTSDSMVPARTTNDGPSTVSKEGDGSA